ncbi:unnamed protein product [Effrenium voratum]|nr:unnamed protein product [Effrenium voratum]
MPKRICFTILRPEWVTEARSRPALAVRRSLASVHCQVVSEITRYNSLDMEEFMRMIQMYEARQYSEFAVVFEHFDIDKNGRLEAEELAALLENCNITALDQVLKEILVEVAPLDSDHLTVEEFKRVVEIIHVNEGFSSREIMRLKEVFRKFDLDRGGFLDCRELHKAMAWLGYGLTNEEVEQISNSCDVGGKGQLEEHEFFGFMRKVKEREIGLVKKALSRQRPDGNNVYMQKQLDRVLRTLGYIPNAQAIRDAAEDAGIIRANPAEEVELSGHGLQPWKSNVAGRRTSLAGSNSRRAVAVCLLAAGTALRLWVITLLRLARKVGGSQDHQLVELLQLP